MFGPFAGGWAASTKVRTGALEAAFFAVCISLFNTAPLIVAWLWLANNSEVLFGPFAVGRQEVPVLGWFTLGFALYMGITAFAGGLYGERRKRRKARRLTSLALNEPL